MISPYVTDNEEEALAATREGGVLLTVLPENFNKPRPTNPLDALKQKIQRTVSSFSLFEFK